MAMTSVDSPETASARPLVLCHHTMSDVPPPEFVVIATRQGSPAEVVRSPAVRMTRHGSSSPNGASLEALTGTPAASRLAWG